MRASAHRQAVAVLALVGVLLSVYLTLFKLGMVGELRCGGSGSCELVQLGPYGAIFGIPVAAFGAVGYLLLLVIAIVGLQPRWLDRPEPTRWLVIVSGLGVLFTAYLFYLEIFRIHAICRWCVGSAVIIALIFVASLLGSRRPLVQA